MPFLREKASAVADFVLVVVHAQHGISVGTERVSNYADECGIPEIIVINDLR
jgi:translation elongation factor EF-G